MSYYKTGDVIELFHGDLPEYNIVTTMGPSVAIPQPGFVIAGWPTNEGDGESMRASWVTRTDLMLAESLDAPHESDHWVMDAVRLIETGAQAGHVAFTAPRRLIRLDRSPPTTGTGLTESGVLALPFPVTPADPTYDRVDVALIHPGVDIVVWHGPDDDDVRAFWCRIDPIVSASSPTGYTYPSTTPVRLTATENPYETWADSPTSGRKHLTLVTVDADGNLQAWPVGALGDDSDPGTHAILLNDPVTIREPTTEQFAVTSPLDGRTVVFAQDATTHDWDVLVLDADLNVTGSTTIAASASSPWRVAAWWDGTEIGFCAPTSPTGEGQVSLWSVNVDGASPVVGEETIVQVWETGGVKGVSATVDNGAVIVIAAVDDEEGAVHEMLFAAELARRVAGWQFGFGFSLLL